MNPSLGGFGLGVPASHDPEKASPGPARADRARTAANVLCRS